MWWRPAWFSLKGKVGIRSQRRGAVLPHPALSTNPPADPCPICGRPLPGKGKLQDCRGAWSDAAICPASGAAANRRGPVWEFADRVPNHSRVLEVRCCTLVDQPMAVLATTGLIGERASPASAA